MSTKLAPPTRRASVQTGPIEEDVDGFDFATYAVATYKDDQSFHRALYEQRRATSLAGAECLRRIDGRGTIEGTDLRLSVDAFGDLAHLAGLPVSFMNKLSRHNQGLALDVVHEMLNARGPLADRTMVVDDRTNIVAGIVSTAAYTHVPTVDVLDWCLSTGGYKLSSGWIEGPNARFTILNPKRDIQPKKGDVVRYGFSVSNAIHGDSALNVAGYFERLVCTNGMVKADAEGAVNIRHVGDVHYKAQEAIVRVVRGVEEYETLMHRAAGGNLLPNEIKRVRGWVADPANGGGARIETAMVQHVRAGLENDEDAGVSLWDMINGINVQAHEAPTLHRREALERLTTRALRKFVADFN